MASDSERPAKPSSGDGTRAVVAKVLVGLVSGLSAYDSGTPYPYYFATPHYFVPLAVAAIKILATWQDVEVAVNMVPDWEDARAVDDALSDMRGAVERFALMVQHLPANSAIGHARLNEALSRMVDGAGSLAAAVPDTGTRRLEHVIAASNQPRGVPTTKELAQEFIRARLVDLTAVALSLRKPSEARSAAVKGLSSGDRVRLRRAREKRGLRHRVPVNVYDDDLSLLRRFGFLAANDMADKDAIGRALEVLLFASYLTHQAYSSPEWSKRLSAQSPRLADLIDGEAPDQGE